MPVGSGFVGYPGSLRGHPDDAGAHAFVEWCGWRQDRHRRLHLIQIDRSGAEPSVDVAQQDVVRPSSDVTFGLEGGSGEVKPLLGDQVCIRSEIVGVWLR